MAAAATSSGGGHEFTAAIEAGIDGWAGMGGGLCALTIVYPLENFTTRQQVDKQGRGTLELLADIIRKEGPLAVYKGFASGQVAMGASMLSFFYFHSYMKRWLQKRLQATNGLSAVQHVCAAWGAGMITACLTNPLWLVNNRMKLSTADGQPRYKGVVHALQEISRTEGIATYWKGLDSSMFGTTLNSGLSYATYEVLKTQLFKYRNMPKDLSAADYLIIGGLSKFLTLAITYPASTITARVAIDKADSHYSSNFLARLFEVIREEGPLALYKGLGTRSLQFTCQQALKLYYYEVIARIIRSVLRGLGVGARGGGGAVGLK
jgi:hypothetical protein